MDNIWFFLITVSVYSAIAISFGDYIRVSLKKFFKVIVTAMLLALPIDIGGNVFTIAGNAVAEKNIYSLFSVYQQAGQDAVTGLGLEIYQKAGRGARVPISIALYQRVGEKTRAFGAFLSLT